MTELKEMFAAEMDEYGTPTLSKVRVVRETKSTYQIDSDSEKEIVGCGLYRKAIRKAGDSIRVFKSGEEAAAYLVKEGEKVIADRQKEIRRLESVIGPLRKMARASGQMG